MPAWWSRLVASPKRIAAAGGAFAVVAAVVAATIVLTSGSGSTEGSADPEPTTSVTPSATPTVDETPDPEPTPDPTALPADKDEYCPAFNDIRSGGFESTASEEDGVDLDELGRKFDELIDKYSRAEQVSPLSLRDDYGRALGYLREGKKAVDSRDVELLKALVKNLDTLNESMDTILTKSKSFCG